ncbi:GtrA family protein [Luteimonas sp. SDU101]|uniref:GtrA family protein n=1 Tax=Luteimonas sp. SDU101 TaxID=3422593 RepID=UPI003EBD60E8
MKDAPPRAGSVLRLFLSSSGLRFLVGGAVNTVLTFALYWLLMLVVSYQVAYAASYCLGIALSYAINTRMVFRVRYSVRSAIRFPLVYVAGYLAGAAVLAIAVRMLGVSPWFAPVLSVCATLPLTYLLTRLILVARARH